MLALAVTAAATASADDARVFKLTRHSPTVGDSFHAEVTTIIRNGTAGQPLKHSVASKLAYTCLILSKNDASGRFDTRLDSSPRSPPPTRTASLR